ncbi:hypothetical protein CFBP1573P_03754 [Pseudomonas syringae pv. persicae]|uniref:Uncharacterized protein n=1 Tax=Pseudomonas syringae pv. persicae TaxID=237306 RepID=A0AB38EH02_9PSED|nr:hypothetical protein NCPPB2254_03646 [Pseudomonas syringae pv. persicae]SOQ11943.1 hypothetical protein CFBP1573P_03754 [Pseudomonas syringae pv. persicae]
MKLLAIVQGDTTDHGGSVINGDQTKRINGFPVAHRDAPINLLRSGGESQFARHPALFAENGLMQRALRAFPPGFPC